MLAQPVEYGDDQIPLTGLLVWDDARTGRRPGVLVAHGGAGLDDHAKGRANKLARLGFVAFACDLYGEGVKGHRERVIACLKDLSEHRGKLRARALAGLRVLSEHPLADERLAAVGYCFGGMTVLELARGGTDLRGIVSVHGSLHTPEPAPVGAITARVLVCHGALDPHVPTAQVIAFVDEMNRAKADWQLVVYGGAMHGFTHEGASADKTPGVEYNGQADARSSAAIAQFLAEVFS